MVYLGIEVINTFLVICLYTLDREYEDSLLFIFRDLENHTKHCLVEGEGWSIPDSLVN